MMTMNSFCSALAFIFLLSFAKEVYSFPSGAPAAACGGLLPTGHSGTSNLANSGPGGFFIYSELFDDGNAGAYEANTMYNITLANPGGTVFRGFVIQARDDDNPNSLIGSFTVLDSGNSQTLTCSSDPDSTVTHPNRNDKTEISFQWTSPSSPGTVQIRYTVVISRNEDYYGNLNAADHRPSCPFLPTALGDHLFRFGIPEDCTGSNCNYYVGLNVNRDDSDYLDVYLEGVANGWVAVGFSMDDQMDADDVLGCRVDASNVVTTVDTWNPSPRETGNVLDDDQDDICMHAGSFDDGRISCSFSRLIDGGNIDQDHNLNDTFYLLFGRRLTAQTSMNLASHRVDGMNPVVSPFTVNPLLDENPNATPPPNGTCPPAPATDAMYTFQFNNPGDNYYLAARVNPTNGNYIDIQLEGSVAGWVGIGFSDNRMMESDDVIGCIRDSSSSDVVSVVDTYNPSNQYGANRRDTDQSGVCTHVTNFVDNRISCTFSRLMVIADDPNSRNLNESWFLLFGTGENGGNSLSSLPRHLATPTTSESRANVATDASAATSNFPRTQLLKAHGIIMIVTWPLLAVVAIFFAAWMRPALPNGEWFMIHRIFMVVALFTGALGFILAFVANADNPTPGLISFACGENRAHFALGFIVFALQIANPIIAIFRCAPTGERRWIFNLIHGNLIGLVAELLGLANVGIGIALFEAGGCIALEASQYTILWVYIGFVIFLLIVQFLLFMLFTLLALRVEPEKRAGIAPTMLKYFFAHGSKPKTEKPIEMTEKSSGEKPSSEKPSGPPPRKPPSKDAPIRWIGLAIFLPVTLILMLTCIILVIVN